MTTVHSITGQYVCIMYSSISLASLACYGSCWRINVESHIENSKPCLVICTCTQFRVSNGSLVDQFFDVM